MVACGGVVRDVAEAAAEDVADVDVEEEDEGDDEGEAEDGDNKDLAVHAVYWRVVIVVVVHQQQP